MNEPSLSIGTKNKELYNETRSEKNNKNSTEKEENTPLVKVIEISAESEKSWEDAAQLAVKETSKSVRNIKSIYIKSFQANVLDNQITKYRVNAKLSFIVD